MVKLDVLMAGFLVSAILFFGSGTVWFLWRVFSRGGSSGFSDEYGYWHPWLTAREVWELQGRVVGLEEKVKNLDPELTILRATASED